MSFLLAHLIKHLLLSSLHNDEIIDQSRVHKLLQGLGSSFKRAGFSVQSFISMCFPASILFSPAASKAQRTSAAGPHIIGNACVTRVVGQNVIPWSSEKRSVKVRRLFLGQHPERRPSSLQKDPITVAEASGSRECESLSAVMLLVWLDFLPRELSISGSSVDGLLSIPADLWKHLTEVKINVLVDCCKIAALESLKTIRGYLDISSDLNIQTSPVAYHRLEASDVRIINLGDDGGLESLQEGNPGFSTHVIIVYGWSDWQSAFSVHLSQNICSQSFNANNAKCFVKDEIIVPVIEIDGCIIETIVHKNSVNSSKASLEKALEVSLKNVCSLFHQDVPCCIIIEII
ncbi:glutamine synthetase/guanido kinase, partial [Aureobasidium melanogenum]